MLLLELVAGDAIELEKLITEHGGDVEIAREERYFGDAQSVTMIINGGTAIVNLIAATLSFWSAKRTITGAAAGRSFTLKQSSQEQVQGLLIDSSDPKV